jgi:hypothetical protein
MKNYLNKYLHKTFIVCVILLTGALVGCGDDHKDHDHNKMNKPKTHSKSPIVHEGIIHVSVIDKNKDGKVFQDQMDWNVISDAPGKCPLCNMTLAEVTVKEAEENLIKNDFKVK